MKKLIILSMLFLSAFLTSCNKETADLYPVRLGNVWGYVNTKGKYVINPSFEDAEYFFGSLARVKVDGKIGYINSKGSFVINPIYEDGTSFSEGRAFVVEKGSCIKCISEKGKQLFSLDNVEEVHLYSEGLAAAYDTNGLGGYLDKDGKFAIVPQYDGKIQSFSEGLAAVSLKESEFYIDKKGNTVFCSAEPHGFKEGLAISVKNGKFGYLNKDGKIKIDFQFEDAYDFQEGLAAVSSGGRYGFINKNGDYVINPQYLAADGFSEGRAAFFSKGLSIGFLNKKGETAIYPIYDNATCFCGGYAFASIDGKYGLIDKNGNFVIQPQFDSVSEKTMTVSVRSMKFMGGEAVTKFIQRYKDNTWDGWNSSSTLGSILKKYNNTKRDGDTKIQCILDESPVNGLKVEQLIFEFNEKTFRSAASYESFFGFTFQSGTTIKYNNDLNPISMSYHFSLSDSAIGKGASAAEMLAIATAERIGAAIKIDDNLFSIDKTDTHAGYTFNYGDGTVDMNILF